MTRLSVCTLLIFASRAHIVKSSGSGSGSGSGFGPGSGNCVGMFSATDNCDFYLKFFNETVTCPILESKYGMDCLGCSCILPVKNMSSTPAATTTAIRTTTSNEKINSTSATPYENSTSTIKTTSKSTTIDTSAPTTSMSAILEKEIEQVNAFAESINEAYHNGEFQKNMLDLAAFNKVTSVKLVAKLDVKQADTKAETPTQLEGKCQIRGLQLSDFQDQQRDAFKTVMAASSGAKKEQVLIKNVFATSARSRSLRRQLSEGDKDAKTSNGALIVEFVITIERDSKPEEAYKSQEALSPGVIAAVVIMSVIATISVATGAVLFAYRKFRKSNRVGYEDTKQNHKNKRLENSPDSYPLRNFSSVSSADEAIPN